MADDEGWLTQFDYSLPFTPSSAYYNGEGIRSPPTAVGECPMRLLVFPRGNRPDNKKCLSAYLEIQVMEDWLDSWEFPDVRFEIQVYNALGEAHASTCATTHTFNAADQDQGWKDMLECNDYATLKTRGWIFVEDSTIRFHVKVKGSSLQQSMRMPKESDHYAKLWQDMKFTDMSVSAGENGALLPCHRAVLAASSPVFDRMLSSGMKEGVEQKLSFPETSTTLAQTLLQHIYTGSISVEAQFDANALLILLPLADQYELDQLAGLCAKRLVEIMSPSTVVDVIAALRTHCDNQSVAEHFAAAKEAVHKDRALFDKVIGSVRGDALRPAKRARTGSPHRASA